MVVTHVIHTTGVTNHAAYLECLTPSEESPRAMLSNLSNLLCPPTVDGSVMEAGSSTAKSAAASLSLVCLLLLLLASDAAAVATDGFTLTDLQQQQRLHTHKPAAATYGFTLTNLQQQHMASHSQTCSSSDKISMANH